MIGGIIGLVLIYLIVRAAVSSSLRQDRAEQQKRADIECNGRSAGALNSKVYIAIREARLGKEPDDKDAIIVSYDLSHRYDTAVPLQTIVKMIAFQSGNDLERKMDDTVQKIREGTLVSLENTFLLDNLESPVEIKVTNPFDSKTTPVMLSKTFDLSTLQ